MDLMEATMTEAATAARLTGLETRVSGIEQGMKDVVTAVSLLSNEIKEEGRRRSEQQVRAEREARESNRTPWGVIFSGLSVMVAVLVAIGGLAYAPIISAQGELKLYVRELDRSQVPRVEHEKVWALQQRLFETQQKRIERLEEDLYRRGRS